MATKAPGTEAGRAWGKRATELEADFLRNARGTSAQLMRARELSPHAIQGDRFEPDDDDVSYAPELEEEPRAQDIRPDQIRAMPGESLDEVDDAELTARVRDAASSGLHEEAAKDPQLT